MKSLSDDEKLVSDIMTPLTETNQNKGEQNMETKNITQRIEEVNELHIGIRSTVHFSSSTSYIDRVISFKQNIDDSNSEFMQYIVKKTIAYLYRHFDHAELNKMIIILNLSLNHDATIMECFIKVTLQDKKIQDGKAILVISQPEEFKTIS